MSPETPIASGLPPATLDAMSDFAAYGRHDEPSCELLRERASGALGPVLAQYCEIRRSHVSLAGDLPLPLRSPSMWDTNLSGVSMKLEYTRRAGSFVFLLGGHWMVGGRQAGVMNYGRDTQGYKSLVVGFRVCEGVR